MPVNDAGRPAYLDCAASTPMRDAAVQAMLPFLTSEFGNPSGAHRMARSSRAAIDETRDLVAEELGFGPHDIVFTGGGTEADNLALLGVVAAMGGVAVCPATEHHAVLHPVESVGGRLVAVHPDGTVDLDDLAANLDHTVSVVSVMLVNNESGVLNDLQAVREVVRQHAPQAVLHSDAVQGVNWVDVRSALRHVDMASFSGHKFGGPKGVGVLAVRPSVTLRPQLLGGGQEAERRSGTHNTAGIVALGVALRELGRTRATDIERLGVERDRLADGLCSKVSGCHETVSRTERAAGLLQLTIEGIESEALLVLLERGDVMASAASSCASGAIDPSHVLAAMGVSRERAAGSLRLSLGWCTQPWEIDQALRVIPDAVRQLRTPVPARSL